jgi:hypothetical protein
LLGENFNLFRFNPNTLVSEQLKFWSSIISRVPSRISELGLSPTQQLTVEGYMLFFSTVSTAKNPMIILLAHIDY